MASDRGHGRSVINYLRKHYIENGCTEPKYHPLSRPARCEAEAVNRMIHLAAMAGDAPLYRPSVQQGRAPRGDEGQGFP